MAKRWRRSLHLPLRFDLDSTGGSRSCPTASDRYVNDLTSHSCAAWPIRMTRRYTPGSLSVWTVERSSVTCRREVVRFLKNSVSNGSPKILYKGARLGRPRILELER